MLTSKTFKYNNYCCWKQISLGLIALNKFRQIFGEHFKNKGIKLILKNHSKFDQSISFSPRKVGPFVFGFGGYVSGQAKVNNSSDDFNKFLPRFLGPNFPGVHDKTITRRVLIVPFTRCMTELNKRSNVIGS